MGLFDFIHTLAAAKKGADVGEILKREFGLLISDEAIKEQIMFFSEWGTLSENSAFDIAIYTAISEAGESLYEGSDEKRTRHALVWLSSSRNAQARNRVGPDAIKKLTKRVKAAFELQSDDLSQMIDELQQRSST